MKDIGFFSAIAQQASITSWHRLCISGLPLCTDAKSSSSSDCPDAREDADPPPKPIK